MGLPENLSPEEIMQRTTYMPTVYQVERTGSTALLETVDPRLPNGNEVSSGRYITPADLDEYGHVPSNN